VSRDFIFRRQRSGLLRLVAPQTQDAGHSATVGHVCRVTDTLLCLWWSNNSSFTQLYRVHSGTDDSSEFVSPPFTLWVARFHALYPPISQRPIVLSSKPFVLISIQVVVLCCTRNVARVFSSILTVNLLPRAESKQLNTMSSKLQMMILYSSPRGNLVKQQQHFYIHLKFPHCETEIYTYN